jgi:hypothetical protein
VDDVVLVMRAGKPLYGDKDVLSSLTDASACDPVDVCGRAKSLCASAESGGKSYPALATAVGASTYGAFFCGVPDNEPTCAPRRPKAVNNSTIYDGNPSPDDMDGDGIPNAMDNCPTVFNPIRPLDGGKQGDADMDGIGDVCDPCPLDAGTTCGSVNANDVDGDGVTDSMDNCPTVANADQADSDTDGKGNACDACPNAANMGNHGCPATIYDIKSGAVPVGATVALTNVLVTAVKSGSFFVQVKETESGVYNGPNNSGVYVFRTGTTPAVAVGNRVTIDPAVISSFFGEIELTNPTVTVTSSSVEAPPAPIAVTPAEVVTGGSKAGPLEGVVVKVSNVVVSDTAPAPAGGDKAPTNEYAVDSALRIDDLFYLTAPFPVVGTKYNSISGVLVTQKANSKIEPRDVNDLVAGPPSLISLGPDAFTRESGAGGADVATIPASAQLQVVLSRPAQGATVVTLSVDAADQGTLTVPASVTVPDLAVSAPVLVHGIARNTTPVTITATLDGISKTGKVRVLDNGTLDVPALLAITPSTAAVTAAGGSVNLSVLLDLPAPAAGVPVALQTANGWTLMPSVTVLQDAVLGPFTVTQATSATDTVTATLNGVVKTATVGITSRPVINEVDYDQTGTDTNEFVEIYNPGAGPIDLSNLAVVFATNGANEYLRVPLSGTLDVGKYLVIGSSTVTVPVGTTKIDFAAASNNIQNSTPTGVAIIDTTALKVIDAVSLNGVATGMTFVNAQLVGFTGKTSFLEGTWKKVSDTTTGSCARLPNGTDTDNLATDWAVSAAPTPGAANTP